MTALRRLLPSGIQKFRAYLDYLRANPSAEPPTDLLSNDQDTQLVSPLIDVAACILDTKREAAAYLVDVLKPLAAGNDLMNDVGLWSWLSVAYFESVCPKRASNTRKPLADAHYIIEAANYKRRYRHLLATPYRILTEVPDHNRLYLDAPLSIHGEAIEQTSSKLYIFRLPAVREIIDRLYFDSRRGRPKSGLFANNRRNAKPGDLRNRLPLRIEQLQKTYDVAGLNADELLKLLGSEFDRWKSS